MKGQGVWSLSLAVLVISIISWHRQDTASSRVENSAKVLS
jgi:hypothetical protein